MRTVSLKLSLILLVLATASVAPLSGIAKNLNNNSAADATIVGYISDSSCGLKHMPGMGDDKSCALMCVKGGGKLVLADKDHKRVYQLDKVGQEKARDFASQKVKVTGRLSGKTIRVTAMDAAS